jgi:hypothetical protein
MLNEGTIAEDTFAIEISGCRADAVQIGGMRRSLETLDKVVYDIIEARRAEGCI